MKKIHILESTLKYLLDEGRNAEKAKQKTIAVMKSYLSQNGIQGEQLESMAMEYENSFKEWLFHANMPDSIIRLEPIMANVAMQLGFTPQNKNTRELYRLQDITNYIIANYNKEDFPIALNKLTLDNTTFESLNELFGSAIDVSKGTWKPSNDGKPKPHYTVKRLDTFEEAHKYHPYTQNICYLGGEGTWNQYTDDGKNAVYVLLRDGWQDVPAEHEKDTPYDDYGKSMVFVIIRPDGDVAYTNTRWNHNTEDKGPRNVDQSFTENMNDVSDMLQTDYRNILKPYSEDELLEKGIITLSMLRRWISEGKDISELCKNSRQVLQVLDNLFKIKLSKKSFVLYNSRLNKFMPSDNVILQGIGPFNIGYSLIQREDGKWSFINTEGQQIGDWYYSVREFYNGFAKVQREDGKWAFINAEGQQIGDWYKDVCVFENGFAEVERADGKWAYINTQGQQICDWYKYVGEFENGYAKVKREDEKWAYINTEGQQIGGWYRNVWPFNDGFAPVQRDDGKWTLINTQGKQICGWYKFIWSFNDGFVPVQRDDGKWSFINAQGKQIWGWYKSACPFRNGFAGIQREDGKWTFINTQGQQICDWYSAINCFVNGVSRVERSDGMVSLINTNGRQICDWFPPKTHFEIVSPNEIYYNYTNKLIPLYNESYTRLNSLIAEALHASIRNYLLYN